MNNWEIQLKEAFGMVHMEPELKAAAQETIRSARSASAGTPWKRAAAVLCMLVLTGYGSYRLLQPVQVISIDINPSIELGINCLDRVVSMEAYNADGEQILESVELRFLKSAEAVGRVMSAPVVQDCLIRQEALTLTVVGQDREADDRLLMQLEDSIVNVEQVYCHSASAQALEGAHGCGLSYGKYLAYLEALEVQPDLTAAQAQTMTMGEIREVSGHHSGGHHGSQQQSAPPAEETQPTTEETAPATTAAHHSSQKKHHGKGHH